LHQDGVTAPIIGPRTRDQLHDARRALDIDLGDDVRKTLGAIFPGFKRAPEHYAW
jgi:aryl-alcohol dehydrogenase-like predicted oxidoreductase